MKLNLKIGPKVPLLIVYLIYLLIFTLRPFDFTSSEVQYKLAENLSIIHLSLNILLFIPFGFLVFLLLKYLNFADYIVISICGLLGILLSFIIETCQLFFYNRSSELSDIFTNTTGTFIGAILAKLYYRQLVGITRSIWYRIERTEYLLTLIVFYSVLFFVLSIFPIKHIDFRNWNRNFSFQIGNEESLNRPWIGELYLVAIYNRALSDKEVYSNFKSGYYFGDDARVKDGLIAFYNFSEGSGTTIRDRSGFSYPLNLNIYSLTGVRWLIPRGLEIPDSAIIKSYDSPKKLYNNIKRTNELSVEVWVAPGNITQEGPARIVSYSESTEQRNFSIGQVNRDIDFRVRTPLSGLNGTRINLKTEDNLLTTEIQHLVATYREGVETLFINGVKHSSLVLFDEVKTLGFFGNGIVSKVVFCFFFFFPLSFLSYVLLSNYFGGNVRYSIVFSILFNVGLLFVIESFYVILYTNKGFDYALIFGVASISVLTPLLCRGINLTGIRD